MEEKQTLSIEEVCARLGIARGTLYKLWRNNKGPKYVRLCGRKFVLVETFEKWLKDQEL